LYTTATSELGDRRLNVLHLPGHSAGSIGLHDAERGILFTADALYDGPMFFDLPGSSRVDFAASVRRIAELEIRRVHPGHQGSFDAARLRALTDQKLSS
jgi:glyoxylase-like metal-dependent hydrolase (beta-lactamase superfamily II)